MSATKETVITNFNFTVIKQTRNYQIFRNYCCFVVRKIKHKIMVRGVTNGMCVA